MMAEIAEYAVYLALLVALALPLSAYINKVMEGRKHVLSFVAAPTERTFARVLRFDASEQMDWKRYAGCVLAFSALSLALLMALLMVQDVLPLNPEGFDGLSWHLAFNTAVSFVTNTNWQSYSGESTLSYFSQAMGLAVQNFVTPAVGIAVLFALMRGLVGEGAESLGSFWVDLVRAVMFIMIPLSLVLSLACVWQGTPQNFSDYASSALVEEVGVTAEGDVVDAEDPAAVAAADSMAVPLGPQASQVAPKQIGTNGGGYNGVNSASPLENPTPLSNLLQCLSLLLIPVALVFSFGRFVGDKRQGRAIFAAMACIFAVALLVISFAEYAGTPQLASDGAVYMGGVGQSGGNMEGKETRFGVTDSALWAAFTTAASNGSVNAMHDSLTPIGGMVTMLLMQLGEIIFGGVGCGLYSMIGFVVLTVFIAGLMVGRTPEYLGKKIGPCEMRMGAVLVICTPLVILAGCAVLCLDPATFGSLANGGPHGFSEVLYAATSCGGNNGSAFAGMNCNTPLINTVLGIEMLVNRFVPAVAALCLAGSMAQRPRVAVSAGTLSTANGMFVFLLVLVVVLIAALSMVPALALGPVAEHLGMVAAQ